MELNRTEFRKEIASNLEKIFESRLFESKNILRTSICEYLDHLKSENKIYDYLVEIDYYKVETFIKLTPVINDCFSILIEDRDKKINSIL